MPAQPASRLATRRGKLLLLLLCAVQFLDVVDSSIMNVALPSIRRDLGFSAQDLQWVLSGYLVTYGGLLLLGGRAGDLLGRRRILVAGTALFAACSLTGGLAVGAGMLVGARLGQGAGAALMAPAGLSILTTSFNSGNDRNRALGVWGAISGLAAAAGVFLGGVLSQGPGWRWVLFVNLPVCALILAGAYRLVPGGRPAAAPAGFDIPGAVPATGGMLLLVTLYMQNVLGFSPIRSGSAYLPVTAGIVVAAGISSRLFARIGTRPVIVAGALIAAAGVWYLSRIPVRGTYPADLLPGLVIMAIGIGAVLVSVTTAANAGVAEDKAGLAAGLLNASQQLGTALGLAIFSAIATSRTSALLTAHAPRAAALTAGFHSALLACAVFLLGAAVIGMRAANSRGEPVIGPAGTHAAREQVPAPELAD